MRETNRARQAFNDYFEMGPNRSLRKLQRIYINPTTKSPPTKHLRSLAIWSKKHNWQDRILQREAEIASAQLQDIIENAPKTGYAIWQNRVHGLDKLAQFIDPLVAVRGLFSPTLVREYRGLLDDIAKEMGERVRGIALSGPDGGPIDINFGATARDTLLGRLLSSTSPQDEGRTDKTTNG